ncbi:hypothetical protein [Sphingosinicella terrae]|uniref:hypothetical protein n=1 Tax=Sphingosinicella terrae TaxID=2172047 RepID=UPI000E0DCDC6|nr:hypothetical protein [Sphingosinicella terrae]
MIGVFGLMALALAAAQPAPAPAPPDRTSGYYLSERMETSSRLRLAPDGRFEWGFDVGALSLSSDGRWTRVDGDTVLLTTEPERVPPLVELTDTSRDERDGVAVALEGDSLEAARMLEIEAHYADGSVERQPMERIRRRVTSTPDRPLVALRVGSETYDFWSSRIPVEMGAANVLSFRIAWNDLSRVDFRSVPAHLDGDAIAFEWRGMTLSHRRVDVAEADRATDDAQVAMTEMSIPDAGGTELAVPIGPVPLHSLTGGEPSIGRMAFAPGEPIAATRAASTLAFSDYDGNGHADGVVELRLRLGDLDRDLGRVSDLSWYVRSDDAPQRISALSFSPQDRLLDLDEALARARRLAEELVQAGFVRGAPAFADWADFRLIDPYRYDETVAGWEAASALLGDADASVTGMELFSVRKGRWYVKASVINLLRNGVLLENARPGQEWMIDVEVTEDQEAGIADAAADGA